MGRWPLSHGDGDALLVDSVPGGPVDSPRARDGRRSIPTQRTCLHRPNGGRSASETVPDKVVNWQLKALPVALLASTCWPGRSMGHGADHRHHPVGTSAEWCGPSDPASERLGSAWNLEGQLHQSIQEPVVALAVDVVVLVPPNLLGFFFTSNAAVSAKALSLRLSSFSKSLIRFVSTRFAALGSRPTSI